MIAHALLASGLTVLGASAAPAQSDGAENWTTRNASADDSAYRRLTQIDARNVNRLGLVWSLDLPYTALSPESFRSVVHDGALLRNGMPKFDDLDEEQLRQIYAYIRAGARAALAHKPASASR